MSKNRKQKRIDSLEEMARLRANRRKDIIKCAGALAAIMVLVGGKAFLEGTGLVEVGNAVVGGVMMMGSIGLAVLAGHASIDFTKNGHRLEYLRSKTGLTKEDVKEYERSR